MIITILGVLKSGGAYVPIDTEYSQERINYIKKDSGCKVVIDEGEIEIFKKVLQQFESKNDSKSKSLTSLLCCIYTSGSTGMPKGVNISNQNILNRIYWMWDKYPFKPNERTCVKTNIGFVDHIWEVFGGLLVGVTSIVVCQETVNNIEQFVGTLQNNQVTRLVLIPSLLRLVLELDGFTERLTNVYYWTCSGEPLPMDLINLFYEKLENSVLLNVYGSTEVSADVTCYNTRDLIKIKGVKCMQTPALFRPINNTDSYFKEMWFDIHQRPICLNNSEYKSSDEFLFLDLKSANEDSPENYRKTLKEEILPNTINVASKYFIGHMTGPIPPFLYSINKDLIRMNQNLVKFETSGIATKVEREVLSWFHQKIFKYSDKFYDEYGQSVNHVLGVMTNGGTLSNITALQYVMASILSGNGIEFGINEIGLLESLQKINKKEIVIFASELHHYSIKKAAKILGVGRESIIPFRLHNEADIQVLQEKIEECNNRNQLILAIVGVAGTTESGEIDDLVSLSKIAQKNKIHFHVDAAYGGAFLLSDYAAKLNGIEKAGSVTICGHKQLYMPMGSSMVFFNEPDFIIDSENNTNYQARKGSADLGKFTLEGSRPFNSLLLHAAIKLHGEQGYRETLNRNIELALMFYSLLTQFPNIEIYNKPELNILLYRFIPKEFAQKRVNVLLEIDDLIEINNCNEFVQKTQFEQGKYFVSHTKVLNADLKTEIVWLRAVFMNPFTSKHDLIDIIKDQHRILDLSFPNLSYSKDSIVPIGKPISNTRVFILSDRLNLLPLGSIGEIVIEGDAVTLGYVGAKDDGKFHESPFDSSKKIYRTGDLGYWLRDGNLVHAGRKDNQIKLRGNRIDPLEIQLITSEYQGIINSYVMMKEGQMVLFYQGLLDNKGLKKFLESRLPSYMIPKHFICLDKFPLNTSGKVDKNNLLDLVILNSTEKIKLLSGTWLEGKIQEIWSNVLNKKELEIGFDEDFFDLGGDSLKLIKTTALINKKFDRKLKFRDILQASTIQGIREILNNSNISSDEIFYSINSINKNKPTLLLLPPSNGEGLVYKRIARMLDGLINVYTLDYPKPDFLTEQVDISFLGKDLSVKWKEQFGNMPFYIGGYSLGFRVAYKMAIHSDCFILQIYNLDGMLYKDAKEELEVNSLIIAAEKNLNINDNKENVVDKFKWFKNDYFETQLKIKTIHFIGVDSIVKDYIPNFISQEFEISEVEGSHETILEIENNLKLVSEDIIGRMSEK